jgi:hypothetical protein
MTLPLVVVFSVVILVLLMLANTILDTKINLLLHQEVKRMSTALMNVALLHGVWDEKKSKVNVQLCDVAECETCGLLTCPHGLLEHFWKDGCPTCDAPEERKPS